MADWPYSTQRWQRLRRLKLQSNPLCEPCLHIGRIEPAIAVDHTIAISAGGDPFPPLEALTSCCVSCHNRKTRVVEQQGKALTAKGCDANGMPFDPLHPWFKG